MTGQEGLLAPAVHYQFQCLEKTILVVTDQRIIKARSNALIKISNFKPRAKETWLKYISEKSLL